VAWPRLGNAPITEALLDIRVELPAGTSLAALTGFHDLVRDRYPQREERRLDQIEVRMDPAGTQVSQTAAATGYLMRALSGEKAVQARLDGFTFNKLRPYESWELFRDEGRELWEKYVGVAFPSRVTRLGLRFINRLELPLPLKSFAEFIRTIPEVAPSVPQELSELFMRLVIPKPEIGAAVIIHEALANPTDPDRIPLILDLDAFAMVAIDPNSNELWDRLEQLREFKNQVFFGSLTDRCLEMYK
jgi:uncharacterized protein (TIGR04255 family)